MPRLHGTWIVEKETFWIWGEQWQPIEEAEDNLHPFSLGEAELINLLTQNYQLSGITEVERVILSLPSYKSGKSKKMLPLLGEQKKTAKADISTFTLHKWSVQGVSLPLPQVLRLFEQGVLGITEESPIGEDLRFWGYIYSWSLDLINRQKFLPNLISSQEKGVWYPILDSLSDQTLLARLIQGIPPACYAYENLRTPVEELILSFLRVIFDQCLRQKVKTISSPPKRSWILPWLKSLSQKDAEIKLDSKSLKRLENALHTWTLPVQDYLLTPSNVHLAYTQFHTCFILTPPEIIDSEDGQGDWLLKYGLQALDDSNFLVEAETIWSCSASQLLLGDRVINYPQETLLKGLGIAAKLYEPVKMSLQESLPTHCSLNPIQAYELIRAIAWQLQDKGLGVIFPPGLSPGVNEKRLGLKIQAEVSPGERLTLGSLLNYDLFLAVGEETLSRSDFEKLLQQRSPLVEVKGQWFALQPADVRAAQAILNKSYEKTPLSVENALRVSLGEPGQIAKLPIVSFTASGSLKNLLNHLMGNQGIEPITHPVGFQGTLRPYQANGVGWLAFLEEWGLGACLADDMGLGKTPQLLGFLLHLQSKNLLKQPVLIVCPTSVITNWTREVAKFAPSLSTIIHHGDKRSKGNDFKQMVEKYNLVITSYSLIQRDLKSLEGVTWQGIVLDEAQNIKNHQARQSIAIRKLKGNFKVALTGTPVENRLSELWSIFEFLNPGFLGSQAFFQRRFALPIEKTGDRDALNILRSLVRPFILRRLKTDTSIIQDLPEKQEMNVFCSLSTEQANLYQNLVETSLAQIEESIGIQRHGLILTLLLKLKQLCNHPALFLKEKELSHSERSGKLLRLEEMLEELIAEGDRALIFTQFAEWGKLLVPYLEKRLNRPVLFLYGGTSRQNRQTMIDRFQQDPNAPPIFILSLKAGGTGLNLTRANHVFHVDRWWNPAVENQATDRAFRIGQKQNVQVHKFICTGTLEERINAILEGKKMLAQQTVDAGEQWLTELDTQALRNLLLLDRDAVIDEDKIV